MDSPFDLSWRDWVLMIGGFVVLMGIASAIDTWRHK